ncbi:MAG TPA: DUF2007 domain-containing protein [Bacteroidales bacterium]|jgi:hypothetical protein|nr:DUF2007 domain-containing protein [Bacteroidales bacterium]MDI9593244.1 DUF2007 domain-containing protein [Bacteroidota bacterium]MBP7874612.1 DUF2007 domain-containing protein [Bacteroidales bacterium]MCZ2281899.1 DUF2007 domain-containing protein [Bacteroidales bacterium]HNY59705.1 DUF2007 domain-containing protein [Bacteroidales bacterium]
MNNEWIVAYTSNNMYKVDLVKGLLLENGIKSEIMNKKDSVFLTGEIELYVHPNDFKKAQRIISERKDIE